LNLRGIFPPLTTPFAAEGSVAIARLRENIAQYNAMRLAGYVVNGSTSESVLLKWEEVYQVWETAKESAAPGRILIAGTGAESTAETIEHTNRAAALGFDAALVRTPSFYKPAISVDMLAAHYLRVADAARIPILIYSVPLFTHVTVEASLIVRIGAHPNIIGIKDSSGDVEGTVKIIAAAPKRFCVLVGSAAMLYESLQKGASGAVLAISNVFPKICSDIYEAAQVGDSARALSLQQKLIAPAKMLGPQYGIAGIKYALDRIGFYGGAPRPPLLPVGEEARREIDDLLAPIFSVSDARP
jgi:4-hydroxy-2-oxoglutarate aldolase